MKDAHFGNPDLDQEARGWILLIKDRLPGAESQRIQEILDSPDPLPRAEEADIIRPLFRGKVAKPSAAESPREAKAFFDQAVAELTGEFARAAAAEQIEAASQDAMELAVQSERVFGSPEGQLSQPLTAALAFKDRLTNPSHRLVMDAVQALALARGGAMTQATQLKNTIDQAQAQIAGMPPPDRQRIESIGREIETLANQASPLVVSNKSATSRPSEDAIRSRVALYAPAVIEVLTERARGSEPVKSTRAIDAAVRLILMTQGAEKVERFINEMEAGLGHNPPTAKVCQIKLMRMWLLSWKGQPQQAVRIADEMAHDYLMSFDNHTADICADAICHAYYYSAVPLHDPDGAQHYLQLLIDAYPGGRYRKLIAHFKEVVVGKAIP